MKKTLIVLMMVLLATMLMVSCDDSNKGDSGALPTVSKAGDVITLGKKDGVGIKWKALDVNTDEKKALLISQDILENKVFFGRGNTGDYIASDIREYFTNTESDGFIKTYGLSTDYMLNEQDLTDVNVEDKDYVFLLSESEVTLYLGQKADRVAKYNGTAAEWWLRSHKGAEGETVDENGTYCQADTSYGRGLRPAFWYTWE